MIDLIIPSAPPSEGINQFSNGRHFFERRKRMPSKYKLSPSASERFLTCTASLPHNLSFTENKATLKGQLQHAVAQLRLEQIFLGKDNAWKLEKLMNPKNKYTSRNDTELFVYWDDESERTVSNYITYIKAIYEEYKPISIEFEKRIKMVFYGNTINGVIDCVMITKDKRVIIVDLKTGRVPVDTEDNKQMLMYANGTIQDLFRKDTKIYDKILISICQSLINNTQAVEYTLKQLIDWYVEQKDKMNEINTNNLVFNPSKTACKYCQYRDNCSARIKAGVI